MSMIRSLFGPMAEIRFLISTEPNQFSAFLCCTACRIVVWLSVYRKQKHTNIHGNYHFHHTYKHSGPAIPKNEELIGILSEQLTIFKRKVYHETSSKPLFPIVN